ncbi:predicted integral membrane protein [Malacoplasma penetrans HF-2]|uniref:Predicted integral membrane protein n=1 Tax=Malacoplasma penetrans (strain HF-2) TaxID=272633 RepID=Q8EWG1_MALP2|nr:hypothetical protein [Malacoplasma penetrans]BAC44035.1 predicted integral membrane protein [Malacoplasma penetrans HF-2]
MGRRERERGEKKGGFLSFIFKLVFCLLFIALGLLTTLFTVTYIGYNNHIVEGGWEWAAKIPFVTDIYTWIAAQGNTTIASTGVTLILVGLDVSLLYFGIMFIIKKIPLIGRIIRWLTGIIPTLGIIAIVIGVVLVIFV